MLCGQGSLGQVDMKGRGWAGYGAGGLAAWSNDLSASAPPCGTCHLVGSDLTRGEFLVAAL